MKKIVLTLLALAGSLFAAGSTGTWKGVASTSANRATYSAPIQSQHAITITFTQDGNSVTGTLRPGGAPAVPITSYVANGNTIMFQAGSFTANLQLTDPNTLQGTLVHSQGTTAKVLLKKQ